MVKKLIYTVVVLLLSITHCFSASSIEDITGTIDENNIITVNAVGDTGFGSLGPTLLIFDDFDGGVTGNDVSLTGDTGSWTEYGTYHPIYDSLANSGSHSMRIYDSDIVNNFRQLKKTFPSKVTEFYISYQVAIPVGTWYPGNPALEYDPAEFPADSSWKYTWVMNRDVPNPGGNAGDNDITTLSHISKGEMVIGGNDLNYGATRRVYYYLTDTWWTWTGFNRISEWIKADETNPETANGIFWAQGVSSQDNHVYFDDSTAVFDAPGAESPYQWGQINVPGWVEPNVTRDTRPVYDDVYIAYGPGSAARGLIGNNINFDACTNFAICIVGTWGDGATTFSVRKGSFTTGGAFFFLVDADNVVSDQDGGTAGAQGFPITIGPAPPVTSVGTAGGAKMGGAKF